MFRLIALAGIVLLSACASQSDFPPVAYTRDIHFAGGDYKVFTDGAEASVALRDAGLISASPAARTLGILAIEASTRCAVVESELTEGGRVLVAEIDCTRSKQIRI